MSSASGEFLTALAGPTPLYLDGATGSELEARGVELVLPLWSAVALLTSGGRSILQGLHEEYVRAGADIVTANTFRTNHRALKAAGLHARGRALTQTAVDRVRLAIDRARVSRRVFVAGSVAPVEDCYRPDLVPPDEELRDEHRRHIDNLFDAQVDVILIETMNTVREARIALEYALQTTLPVLLSFVCGEKDGYLPGGESLEDAVRTVDLLKPTALLLNCIPVERMSANLAILSKATELPRGAYANILSGQGGKPVSPDRYAGHARQWMREYSLKIAGGCCGTTPAHIERLTAHTA